MTPAKLSFLCAAFLGFALAAPVQAADPAPAETAAPAASSQSGKFLADRHIARGMKCETCHTPDHKVKQSGDFDVCVDCHGGYEEMIKKTDGRYQVNPHAQHEGVLPCTECHKGHKPGVNYCGQCHSYTYKVP